MRKPIRIAVSVFGLAVIAFVLWLFLRPAEATYNGKPVDYWIGSMTNGVSAPPQPALVAIGLPALPRLISAYEKRDSGFVRAYATLWLSMPWKIRRFFAAPFPWDGIHFTVVQMIGEIGRDYRFSHDGSGEPTPPELRRAVQVLASGLSSSNADDSIWCTQALAFIGPNAREAVPALLQMYRRNSGEGVMVFQALGTIGPNPHTAECIKVLAAGLDSNDKLLRIAAADALGGFGSDAVPAVPGLIRLFTDADPARIPALRAMARIGNLPPDLRLKLLPLLDDESHFIRAPAAVALLRINATEAQAQTIIRHCLVSPQNNIRSSTVYLIMDSRVMVETFQPELRKLKDDPDQNVSAFARHALKQIDAPAKHGIK